MNIKNHRGIAVIGYDSSSIFKTSLELTILQKIELIVRNIFTQKINEGYSDFYTTLLDGFELLTAETIIALRSTHPQARLNIILPGNNREHEFSTPDKCRFRTLLEQADSTKTISPMCEDQNEIPQLISDVLLSECSAMVCYRGPLPLNNNTELFYNNAIGKDLEVINIYDLLSSEIVSTSESSCL